MADLPFFDSLDDEEASVWDECELGGFFLPGLWDLKVKGKRKLDQQEGSGTDYDTTVDKGQRAADVELTGKIFDEEDWGGFQEEVFPALWPKAGKGKPDPKELHHPLAALFRIDALVISDIEAELNDDNILIIKIKGMAWGKPKPSPVKVADKAKGKDADKPDPNSAQQQNPFDEKASALDALKNLLDPTGKAGKPLGQGAPSRNTNLLKP